MPLVQPASSLHVFTTLRIYPVIHELGNLLSLFPVPSYPSYFLLIFIFFPFERAYSLVPGCSFRGNCLLEGQPYEEDVDVDGLTQTGARSFWELSAHCMSEN